MPEPSDTAALSRLARDNPWWDGDGGDLTALRELPRRAFFDTFARLVIEGGSGRPLVLMGPRRAGKTVMLRQAIDVLRQRGVADRSVLYLPLALPAHGGRPLAALLAPWHGRVSAAGRAYAFLDGIEYRAGWEAEIAGLAAAFPRLRVVAAAAAAPRRQRLGDDRPAGGPPAYASLLLPPLTFAEFLAFSGRDRAFVPELGDAAALSPASIARLNQAFIAYLNHGGFPEAAYAARSGAPVIGAPTSGEIVARALLHDLPGLHGIADSRELNRLFARLADTTGAEVGIEGLATASGLAKNTLKRYLAYLEAAFLIRRVHRIDRNGRRFRRAVSFKVYITNPSLRAALIGPVAEDDPAMGRLAETAVVSQWLHAGWAAARSYYARWPGGEVDFVELDLPGGAPQMAVDVMWDEGGFGESGALEAFVGFAKANAVPVNYVLTRSHSGRVERGGTTVNVEPVSRFCYRIGRQIANFSVAGEAGLS